MMNEVLDIAKLSLLMFSVSFVSGMMPLYFSFPKAQLEFFNIIGCGILLGTGLTVIIPEGAHKAFQIESNSIDPSSLLGFGLLSGFFFVFLVELSSTWFGEGESHHHHKHEHHSIYDPLPLEKHHDSNNDLGLFNKVLLGLLIHNISDGISLGASKSSNSSLDQSVDSLNLVVFLAIISHKIPMALTLSIYLKSKSYSFREIRKALVLFSSAAPVSAITTVFLLFNFSTGGETREVNEATEILSASCILFSGGTFVYVACVHLFAELNTSNMSLLEIFALISSSLLPFLVFILIPDSH